MHIAWKLVCVYSYIDVFIVVTNDKKLKTMLKNNVTEAEHHVQNTISFNGLFKEYNNPLFCILKQSGWKNLFIKSRDIKNGVSVPNLFTWYKVHYNDNKII